MACKTWTPLHSSHEHVSCPPFEEAVRTFLTLLRNMTEPLAMNFLKDCVLWVAKGFNEQVESRPQLPLFGENPARVSVGFPGIRPKAKIHFMLGMFAQCAGSILRL